MPKRISDIIDLSYRSETAIEEIKMQTVVAEAFLAHSIELPAEAIEEMVRLEHRLFSASIVLADGAVDVLTELKTLGFKLGIVSNATNLAPLLRRDLERLDILRYFDATVFSSELGLRKPHPRIYEAALRGVGSAPASAIFVGDRIREDIAGPQALGMDAVLTHQFRQESPDGVKPVGIIHDFGEILEIIEQLAAN
jgi:putative hydrolase of the HAD superfamily